MGDSMPQRFLDANNAHDAGISVADLFTPDGTQEDVAAGVVCEGRQAIIAFMAQSEQASNDNRMTILSQQVNDDHYAIEWEVAGTNAGPLGDLPATNKPYRFRGVSIGRLDADGKIKENRDYYDMAGYLTQIGVLPPLGT